MRVRPDSNAIERMQERGAGESEVIATVLEGERLEARLGRQGFRRNFSFQGMWRGRRYGTKQVEVYAVLEDGEWVVITVLTRYF